MSVDSARLEALTAEISAARELSPYHAVNGLWVSLVKLANFLPTAGAEHEQVASMLRRFTREQAVTIVCDPSVNRLLELDPPLETVLADDRERLNPLPAAKQVAMVRERRFRDPKSALAALFEILQRIRDKREHGFKTPTASRDAQILGAALSVLERLCTVAIENLHMSGVEERDSDGRRRSLS